MGGGAGRAGSAPRRDVHLHEKLRSSPSANGLSPMPAMRNGAALHKREAHLGTIEARLGLEIRRLRKALGSSVRAFAERTKFSASFISLLENGQVSPSIGSLGRLASELNTTLAELFARSTDHPATVVRTKKRPSFSSSRSRGQIALLTTGSLGMLEAVMVTLEPSGMSAKSPSVSSHDQFAIVFSGTVVLTLRDETMTLRRGDAVQILNRTPHRWHNSSRRHAQFVVVSKQPGR